MKEAKPWWEKQLKEVIEQYNNTGPSLPAPHPRNLEGITLTAEPRKMYPVHIMNRNKREDSPLFGKMFALDLIAVPMESVRQIFKFNRRNTPESRKNLQIWLDNLGDALYNPIWWKVVTDHQESPRKRVNPWFRKVHGSHRVRALEALDFNFLWTYVQTGACDKIPRDQYVQMKRNDRMPRVSRQGGTCEKCNGRIRFGRGTKLNLEGVRSRHYTCIHCEHKGWGVLIYPEPV